jgi:hypothetical protein
MTPGVSYAWTWLGDKKITRAMLEIEHQSFHRLSHRGLCVNEHKTGYLSDYLQYEYTDVCFLYALTSSN